MYIVHGASTMFPAHTNMCAYTYTHTSICVRIYLHATEGPAAVLIIYVHTCINVYARIYSYHIRAYMHARIYTCIYACTYIYVHTCLLVYIRACMSYMHAYIYTCIYACTYMFVHICMHVHDKNCRWILMCVYTQTHVLTYSHLHMQYGDHRQ